MKPKPQKRRQDLELENSFAVLQEADYSDNEESSTEETESSSQEESTLSYSSSKGNESREDQQELPGIMLTADSTVVEFEKEIEVHNEDLPESSENTRQGPTGLSFK